MIKFQILWPVWSRTHITSEMETQPKKTSLNGIPENISFLAWFPYLVNTLVIIFLIVMVVNIGNQITRSNHNLEEVTKNVAEVQEDKDRFVRDEKLLLMKKVKQVERKLDLVKNYLPVKKGDLIPVSQDLLPGFVASNENSIHTKLNSTILLELRFATKLMLFKNVSVVAKVVPDLNYTCKTGPQIRKCRGIDLNMENRSGMGGIFLSKIPIKQFFPAGQTIAMMSNFDGWIRNITTKVFKTNQVRRFWHKYKAVKENRSHKGTSPAHNFTAFFLTHKIAWNMEMSQLRNPVQVRKTFFLFSCTFNINLPWKFESKPKTMRIYRWLHREKVPSLFPRFNKPAQPFCSNSMSHKDHKKKAYQSSSPNGMTKNIQNSFEAPHWQVGLIFDAVGQIQSARYHTDLTSREKDPVDLKMTILTG